MKELAMSILRCESEDEVSEVLVELPSDATWHPLDGRENQFQCSYQPGGDGRKGTYRALHKYGGRHSVAPRHREGY